MEKHLNDNEIASYVDYGDESPYAQKIENHMDVCPECEKMIRDIIFTKIELDYESEMVPDKVIFPSGDYGNNVIRLFSPKPVEDLAAAANSEGKYLLYDHFQTIAVPVKDNPDDVNETYNYKLVIYKEPDFDVFEGTLFIKKSIKGKVIKLFFFDGKIHHLIIEFSEKELENSSSPFPFIDNFDPSRLFKQNCPDELYIIEEELTGV
jgi:hypothetical protein